MWRAATRGSEVPFDVVDELERLGLAAELHDVGKAAIPDAILEKPGKLDDAEWEFMRRHAVIGESILRAAPSLADTAQLVRSSHEWMDGTGYPDGLRGEEIPIGSRISRSATRSTRWCRTDPTAGAVPPRHLQFIPRRRLS